MEPVLNPFLPGAGTPPPELAGRDELLKQAKITLSRVAQGRGAKSFLLVGLRGVGKTVLLNEIEKISQGLAYKHILTEVHEGKTLPELLVPPLRQMILSLDRVKNIGDKANRALRVLKAFVSAIKIDVAGYDIGLNIDPEVGIADSGDLESDLPELLVTVAEAAASSGSAVTLILDEMQYLDEKELSALIMAVHRIAQKKLPFVLIGAGLPQLVALCGRSKSYSERLFTFPNVGALSAKDAAAALREPVEREGASFGTKAIAEIYKITEGYPYFLQEWAYHSWNQAKRSPIDLEAVAAATPAAIKALDESFFRVRFDRLAPGEKNYLRAMAELGPGSHRSGDIATTLGVKVETCAPVRSALITKGMIFSPSHGDTAFTVPLFDQFMKRIMPELKTRKSAQKTR